MEKDLTILLPCLNEIESLEKCINKAKKFLKNNNIKGEILIADNGSTDGSVELAKKQAKVINVQEKGYGSALIEGIKKAKGKKIIMADSDNTYDLLNLEPFYYKLNEYDMIIGNRFRGEMEKGAMPFANKYIGNPFLSFVAKKFFPCNINDFHCGLRSFNKQKIMDLNLQTKGMEFASEMIIKAIINDYQIIEIPTTLLKGDRTRRPHLRPIRDFFRHLKTIIKLYKNKKMYKI